MSHVLKKTFSCVVLCLLVSFIGIHPAIADEEADKQIPLNQYGIRSPNPYAVDRFVVDGRTIEKVIFPSWPSPPDGFVREKAVVFEPDIEAGINVISNVPALPWCFGCAPTSAAMMFGHYDNAGYWDMYTGPTNYGLFPMTNTTWGEAVINGETRKLCPLSATRLGLDGRTTKGHVDDYWVKSGSTLPDPFIGNWTEHTHGECTGDYMGSNQSSFYNSDGSTYLHYDINGDPLYDFTGSEPDSRDACHGMRLFAESRGYTVNANFTQCIYGWYNGSEYLTKGFTFSNFKAEIDAGRPVMIHLSGHSMLGYGYNDSGSTIYIHDTWDDSDHTMTWGGDYVGLAHWAVTVIRLAPAPPSTCPECPSNGVIGNVTYRQGTICNCSHSTAITIGPGVIIEPGATVTFTAPKVTLEEDVRASSGSNVIIRQP